MVKYTDWAGYKLVVTPSGSCYEESDTIFEIFGESLNGGILFQTTLVKGTPGGDDFVATYKPTAKRTFDKRTPEPPE